MHGIVGRCGVSLLLAVCLGCTAGGNRTAPANDTLIVRVATYNLEDVRTDDLRNAEHSRLKALAAQIQSVRPDVILLNEIAFDQPKSPGFEVGEAPGQNTTRFARNFLDASQGPGLEPIRYRAFAAPSNTGLPSGFDLDRSGKAVTTFPPPPPAGPDGAPGPQTAEGREYGNDAWGFGTFPGQYAMGLLVREDIEILRDSVRTFRLFPWSRMPAALLPQVPETGEAWYGGEVGELMRLSSKSHWHVPLRLPNGTVLHVLASHPTPPAFDGPEQRNVRRNHDEIRFWADYIDGAGYIVDDSSRAGGLPRGVSFVIVGDLNADPEKGNSLNDPVGRFLLAHPRIDGSFVPVAAESAEGPNPENTAGWGMRVDYVLPSSDLRVLAGQVERPAAGSAPSDHFLVWLDLAVPPGQ